MPCSSRVPRTVRGSATGTTRAPLAAPSEGPVGGADWRAEDAAPDRVVLWTHLADAEGDEPVELVVARDDALEDVVQRVALVARAEDGFVVSHDVEGLEPGTTYHYAFETALERSPVGRARTAPAPGAEGALRLAFTTCASYAHGFFHTYARIAERDVYAVVHLGDYIYEYRDGV